MDAMSRTIMQRVVEAIYDAGFHPSELEGTNTGIIIATNNSDGQTAFYRNDLGPQNFALTGYSTYSTN